MKNTIYLKREREKTKQIAREYKEQGYEVLADLPGYEPPFSISGFVPDLIARTEDTVVIVEVKSSLSPQIKKDAIKQFAYYIKKHPNTRLDLIVTNPKPYCPVCGKTFGSLS